MCPRRWSVKRGNFPRNILCRWLVLALLVGVALIHPLARTVPAQTGGVETWTDAQIEEFLSKAKVTKTKGTGKGVTNSIRATLSDGVVEHEAHIQQVDERKQTGPAAQGAELNFRDSWAYNVAAYRLDRLIGLKLVPVSVSRDYRSKPAAFTWWVDDVMMEEGDRLKKNVQPPSPAKWNEYMQLVRIFDALIYNVDRNMGNLLITKDWHVWAIDHTRAFRLHKELKTPASITRCDKAVFEGLKQLDKAKLKDSMSDFLSEWERDAILARRDAIVAILEKNGPGALFTRQ
jgi:hypothetical protein